MRILLFSEVTLFKYNVSTILSPIVAIVAFFSPSSHGPYGFYARTQAFLELIAFLFLILSPGKFEATLLERLISYLISK